MPIDMATGFGPVDSLVNLLQELRDLIVREAIPDHYDLIEIKYLGDSND